MNTDLDAILSQAASQPKGGMIYELGRHARRALAPMVLALGLGACGDDYDPVTPRQDAGGVMDADPMTGTKLPIDPARQAHFYLEHTKFRDDDAAGSADQNPVLLQTEDGSGQVRAVEYTLADLAMYTDRAQFSGGQPGRVCLEDEALREYFQGQGRDVFKTLYRPTAKEIVTATRQALGQPVNVPTLDQEADELTDAVIDAWDSADDSTAYIRKIDVGITPPSPDVPNGAVFIDYAIDYQGNFSRAAIGGDTRPAPTYLEPFGVTVPHAVLPDAAVRAAAADMIDYYFNVVGFKPRSDR